MLEQIGEIETHQYGVNKNLKATELKEIRQLAADPSLILKPANKEGGIVIITMDYDDYGNENLRQLNQSECYEKLMHDATQHLCQLIKITVTEGENTGYINNMQAKFLINSTTRMPLFYMLSKIHKDVPFPPGGPIISACNAVLEPVAQFDDFFSPATCDKSKIFSIMNEAA